MDNGIYIDGLEANGAPSSHASQEANALALAYDVVPESDRAAVWAPTWPVSASRSVPTTASSSCAVWPTPSCGKTWCGCSTDTSQPGMGPHRGRRRDLHLGDLDPERPDRRLAVARLGLLRPGGHGRVAPRGHPDRPDQGRRGAGQHQPAPQWPAGAPAARSRPSPDRSRCRGPARRSTFTLETTIPANAAAAITLPAASASSVREQGEAVGPLSGVATGAFGDGLAYLSVGSGSYRFTSTLRGA